MTDTEDHAPPLAGKVSFIQYHVPPLEAGEYTLTADTVVNIPGVVSESFHNVARFAVAGERFSVDPAEIDSVFPPAGSQGEFFNVLPHLVLTRRTLPWERSSYLVPPAPHDTRPVVPWLALLVFDAVETPLARDATVAELLLKERGGSLPANALSYPIALLEYGEKQTDRCRIIDLPVALFHAVTPSLSDLIWLAHARRVRTAGKATSGASSPAEETDYAVLVANRVPTAGHKSMVHLVSLEGMEEFLPAADGKPSNQVVRSCEIVRLLSLYSWSFDTVSEPETFTDYLEGLDVGMLCMPAKAGSSGDADADALVTQALDRGYDAMDHELREGGTTVSWYRGPFSPVAVARTLATPLASADAALAYDAQTGLFDVSYATAWSLGRLLALQSREFASTLYAWKTTTRRDTVALAEQQMLAQRLQAAAVPGGDSGAQAQANRAAALQFLVTQLPSLLTPLDGVAPLPTNAERLAMVKARPSTLLGDAEGISALHGDTFDVPEYVAQWLGGLRLLHGVPLQYLVPDEAMLPPESLRFFQLDFNWLDALADGAYSIGRATTGDHAHDLARAAALRSAAGSTMPLVRGGGAAEEAPAAPEVVSGFLLRSGVVTGWPGLELNAYAEGAADPLKVLRLEQLSRDILLALFDGVVDRLVIHEPPEGLHFGLDMPLGPVLPEKFVKRLRSLSADKADDSTLTNVPARYRDGSLVLRMSDLAKDMAEKISPPFTAAEFALEMVEGVGRVVFFNQPKPESAA